MLDTLRSWGRFLADSAERIGKIASIIGRIMTTIGDGIAEIQGLLHGTDTPRESEEAGIAGTASGIDGQDTDVRKESRERKNPTDETPSGSPSGNAEGGSAGNQATPNGTQDAAKSRPVGSRRDGALT